MSRHGGEHVLIGSVQDHLRFGPVLEMDEFGWGQMEISARSGAFSAEMACQVSRHDLSALDRILRAQHAQPTLQQSWNSCDLELRLDFSGTIRGGIRLAVRLAEIGGPERMLSYNLDIDQSYLPALIEQVSMMIASMPEVPNVP